jgi:hypothetical protein
VQSTRHPDNRDNDAIFPPDAKPDCGKKRQVRAETLQTLRRSFPADFRADSS